MNTNDLKLALFNVLSFGISFTNIENSLKIILLISSIIYTIQKIIETQKNKKSKKRTVNNDSVF